jgi:hypothetical protein
MVEHISISELVEQIGRVAHELDPDNDLTSAELLQLVKSVYIPRADVPEVLREARRILEHRAHVQTLRALRSGAVHASSMSCMVTVASVHSGARSCSFGTLGCLTNH